MGYKKDTYYQYIAKLSTKKVTFFFSLSRVHIWKFFLFQLVIPCVALDKKNKNKMLMSLSLKWQKLRVRGNWVLRVILRMVSYRQKETPR